MGEFASKKLGFIGAGQMARALARGVVDAGLFSGSQVHASDVFSQAVVEFQNQVAGAHSESTNASLIDQCDIIVLAVKPQRMESVANEVGEISKSKLLVSIAAGVTIEQMSKMFGTKRIVRVMSNTPCLIGQGAAGFSLGADATADDGAIVNSLLSAVGISFEVKESLLDAVTGLSGSGPAFVYLFIEALSDAGVRVGLPRNVATSLAAQTVQGAAAMVSQSGEHPGVLKDRVASPAGTTIAGIQALEEGAFRGTVIDAVQRAADRSSELGQG